MALIFVVALALCAAPVYAQDDPPATRRELDLTLQAVRSQKEKYAARYNLGQMMMSEAERQIVELSQRESALVIAIKQIDDDAKKTKASK